MKILLIYPYFLEERVQDEDIRPVPIGLYWVAAMLLEQGYDVEILNWQEIHNSPGEIEETLARRKPEIIGFSILHGNRWGALDMAKTAKRSLPKVKVVLGGVGSTFLWKHLLTHFPDIDYAVIGEGEMTFLNLVRHIEGGEKGFPEHIRGIAFRKGTEIVKTKQALPIPDLDRLPIPARHFSYQHVSSTRGCAWKCRFCGSPRLWGGRIRYRSPEHFVAELEMLSARGVPSFYVSDDTFTVKKDRVIEICKGILHKNLNLSWVAVSRVDCVDEDILYWMRRAGCTQISYGIESGSDKIRALLNKKITRGQIRKAFELTVRYGILPRAYFIYGSPGETWETIEESVSLMMEIRPLGALFYILDLYPGTEFYEDLKGRGLVTDDLWLARIEGLMHLETDPRLSAETVLAFGKRLRTAFYENLHLFADSIRLVEKEEIYVHHADFCSRLAMTFSQGDYSRNELVREKEKTAEKLFQTALAYSPDERAYLGLGMVKQRGGEYDASVRVLLEGITHFPGSEALNVCLGVSYMNLRDYENALGLFRKYPGSRQAAQYAGECETAMKSPGP